MFVSPHPFSARRTHERVGQTIERPIEPPLADAILAGRVRPGDRLLAEPTLRVTRCFT